MSLDVLRSALRAKSKPFYLCVRQSWDSRRVNVLLRRLHQHRRRCRNGGGQLLGGAGGLLLHRDVRPVGTMLDAGLVSDTT